jgi:hypothetical protein
MTDFVDISDPNNIALRYKSYRIVKKSAAGYSMTRPRGNSPKRTWDLSWDGMSDSDFNSLITFFEANYAEEFNWTHPVTSTSYVVYFVNDEITYEGIVSDNWKVSFTLGEG